MESDVYAAPEALGGRQFDLVYTGIGAIGWLPSIRRWAEVVAALLRPGGRLFIRDGHPVLLGLDRRPLGADPSTAASSRGSPAPGRRPVALELPYFEQPEPGMVWNEEYSYAGEEKVALAATRWSGTTGSARSSRRSSTPGLAADVAHRARQRPVGRAARADGPRRGDGGVPPARPPRAAAGQLHADGRQEVTSNHC